jgi:hypothetical protein
MFKMNTMYAILALSLMVAIYYYLNSKNKGEKQGIAGIFQGVIFQFSRSIQVFLQKSEKDLNNETWRPSLVAFSNQTFQQNSSFQAMKWITRKHGFGSYLHWTKDEFNVKTALEAKQTLKRMIKIANVSHSNFYLDTIVAPSYTGSLVHVLQLPGVSGKDNNMILLDFERGNTEESGKIIENYPLLKADSHDVCVLSTSTKGYGVMNQVHIWIDPQQINNAQMMIVLAYIVLGNSDWRKGEAKVFITIDESTFETQKDSLDELIFTGRIPISKSNVMYLKTNSSTSRNDLIKDYSKDADMLMIGFNEYSISDELLKNNGELAEMANILYVNSTTEKNFGVE